MIIQVDGIEHLGQAAKELIQCYAQQRVFVFYGEMGAGKTTFINALCRELGVYDHTSSPTFSIVNEYDAASGTIYHFDFYRIRHEEEAFDLGYEDYFYSGAYCFIEWPEKIPNLIPEDAVKIKIEVSENQHRTLFIT